MVYTMEYYPAIKKNEILPFATIWTDLEAIMLSEVSQTEKHKYCMISLLCGFLKTKQMNKRNKRESHRHREQTGACQRGGGRGEERNR